MIDTLALKVVSVKLQVQSCLNVIFSCAKVCNEVVCLGFVMSIGKEIQVLQSGPMKVSNDLPGEQYKLCPHENHLAMSKA